MDLDKKDLNKRKSTAKDIIAQRGLVFVFHLFLSALVFSFFMSCESGGKMTEAKPILPETAGLWTRPAAPRIINAETIFDYMDGAGELYLGYRFDHLEVYEYKAPSQKDILVELYYMETSDDAFGLLSLDWGGQPVDLSRSRRSGSQSDLQDWPWALYGEGLLRVWSNNVYARVMSYLETPQSKQAVLALGRSLVQGRENPPGPNLLERLPKSFQPDWLLRLDRASYFRTHLVLNSLFYLSQENILNLDLDSEGITAIYERKDLTGDQTQMRCLIVEYPDSERARDALDHFHRVYLPEHLFSEESSSYQETGCFFSIEDGWLGYRLKDKAVVFIFECPDQETARSVLGQLR